MRSERGLVDNVERGVWKYLTFILALILGFSLVANVLLYVQVGTLQKTSFDNVTRTIVIRENATSSTFENVSLLKVQIEEMRREIEYLRAQLRASRGTFGNATIAVVPIFGPIDDYLALHVVRILRELRDNSSVGGVLLWIESPGGYIGPVRAIYEEVKKLAYEKPVVAYTAGYADSGAYYIACAAEKIIADPLAEVGSIGVIYVHFNAEQYYAMNGIKVDVFKTGPHKDMGADWRGLTEEEKKIITEQIDAYFQEFLRVVSESRNMTLNKTKEFADGRVWFAYQVKGTLVDDTGDMDYALKVLVDMMGVEGARVIVYDSPTSDFGIAQSSALYMPARYVYSYIGR
ncbi:signal peptide peptidase SppA [Pyrococcus yayanosii]|uniref:Putative protease n=1 Tax=Pyrococcus yayanosii (strain CH1 / JCM 16557) TaxID=529709 RepID=F8AGY9_PYRYC|nr:signal peptide peptidase SppA [Pyrococcus yayanosii]AEH24047.1 putative protease [Pyrococcus yayanosii CH1]